jgi:hypothetical protein
MHLERRRLHEIPVLTDSFNVLVCADDTWEGEPEKAVQCLVQLAGGKPAILVSGNHDLYSLNQSGRTISDVLNRMQNEADRQNARARREIVTLLSADTPVCEIERVRFIGLTLWVDWAQAGCWMGAPNDIEWAARARAEARHPKVGRREFGAIIRELGGWTPYDAVAEHARKKAILLDELVAGDGPTVVVTHHPLAECVDAYQAIAPWRAPAFYTSDLLPTVPEQFRPISGYAVMSTYPSTLTLIELA